MLWLINNPSLTGAELFELEETPSENRLRGWIVASVNGVDCAVSYTVSADPHWVTRRVSVRLDAGGTRTLELEHDDDGAWSVDGVIRPDLAGCLDVDLGISPSTNTLPIRRLDIDVAHTERLVAAWVRFSDMVVEPLPQTYERLAESVYRYRSESFQADLEVDERGVVLRYGDDLWRAREGQSGSWP